MNKKLKIVIYVLIALAILGGVFVLGIYLGFQKRPEIEKVKNVLNKEKTEISTKTDFDPFWKVWNIIDEKHPKANKITDQERVWGAVEGLAGSLSDPYTVFFPPTEAKAFQENINGEFGGVGIEIGTKGGLLTVIAPLKGSPAEKAGIRAGDKILKIDNLITDNISIDKAVSLIRGEVGTNVILTVFREGEKTTREIKIARAIIKIPTLETELKDDVFIIRLFNFSANSPNLFREALQKFVDSRTTKLILDLRGNPGGFLEASVDIASWFLPAGKSIVIEKIGQDGEEKIYRSKGYNIFNKNLKFAILIDGGSASASEILAGALIDHGIGKTVGDKTYGKGSVQELVKITDNTSLKVTIAEWLTPNRTVISENGIKPDYSVKMTQEDLDKKRDPQLEKAIEILK